MVTCLNVTKKAAGSSPGPILASFTGNPGKVFSVPQFTLVEHHDLLNQTFLLDLVLCY